MILTRPTLQQEMGNIATQVHNTAKSILLSLSRLGISTHISGQFSRPALSEDQVPQPGAEGVPAIHPETGELSEEAILAADQNLESLFSGLEEDQIQDADAFWESISSDEVDTESGSDTLSYDQAAKLGLAPSDE
jgi:hypothetical protein